LAAKRATEIAASELCRLYGSTSRQEKPRIAAMEADHPPDELPQGRDWTKDVRVGVHSYPSMNHLHIHILSVDRHSIFMNKAAHYNSFNTKFFVNLEEFPLSPNDDRYRPGVLKSYTDGDLICWRCGQNFGRRFARLKEHLEKEFVEWKHV